MTSPDIGALYGAAVYLRVNSDLSYCHIIVDIYTRTINPVQPDAMIVFLVSLSTNKNDKTGNRGLGNKEGRC